MTESPARLLILTYGVLMALFDLVALLPGNPDVSVPGGLFLAVVVQTLIVWRLWHQSGIAWSFGVVVPLLYVIALVLMAADWETTVVLTCFFSMVQIAIVCTPPVLAYVFRRDYRVASH
jgi:hypothetical protein